MLLKTPFRFHRILGFALIVVASTSTSSLQADRKPPQVTQATVLEGLDNPCGVAIQPSTGHVFVSDSGAGRIVRLSASGDESVITGFPSDTYGDGTYEAGTRFDIGPLGLTFVSRDLLLVGGGGLKDGSELVRAYEVPDPGSSVVFDAVKYKLGPLAAGNKSASGEGNFYGVAHSDDTVFVTANGDDRSGWIARAALKNGKPETLKFFIETKEATGIDAPTAITISDEGYLVVSQMGELAVPRDSLLAFYDPQDGALLSAFATGLHDVVGLAYSPASGLLYAVDFAWGEHHKDGGLYRLDAVTVNGKPAVAAVKVLDLEKPTSLAFAPNNALYVTTIGAPPADGSAKSGKLIRVTGKF